MQEGETKIRRGGGRGPKKARGEEKAVRGRAGGITARRGEAEEGKGLQQRRREVKGRRAVRGEVEIEREGEVKVKRRRVEAAQ